MDYENKRIKWLQERNSQTYALLDEAYEENAKLAGLATQAIELVALMNLDNFKEDSDEWIKRLQYIIKALPNNNIKEYLEESLQGWYDAQDEDYYE